MRIFTKTLVRVLWNGLLYIPLAALAAAFVWVAFGYLGQMPLPGFWHLWGYAYVVTFGPRLLYLVIIADRKP